MCAAEALICPKYVMIDWPSQRLSTSQTRYIEVDSADYWTSAWFVASGLST